MMAVAAMRCRSAHDCAPGSEPADPAAAYKITEAADITLAVSNIG
jgi:hypothetical protein